MNDIKRQAYTLTRKDRESIKGHESFLIWFTGLSGAGKSTIANALEVALHERAIHTYLLDGDNLRLGLNKSLKFSEEDRNENLRRTAEVAKLFLDAGNVVLAAFISPFKNTRETIKSIVGAENYIEVYVKTSLSVCEERDVKGLYKKARTGALKNFTGISSPYEEPVNPDIVIETETTSTQEAVEQIMTYLNRRLK